MPGTGFQPLAGFETSHTLEIDDVTATPSGFMAVGFGGLDGGDFFGGRQGIVWTSADGINWSESVDASLRNVSPELVAVRGADYFIAGFVSACGQDDEDCTDVPESGYAIFHSTDQVTWQILPQLPDMQYGELDGMLVAADLLVVFGLSADENQTPTVWQSADGATWSSTTNVTGIDTVSAMAYGNNVLTAFGTRYVPDLEDVVLTAATSTDGTTFTPATVPDVTGGAILGVVQGTNGFAGVGYASTEALEIVGVTLFSADGMTWTEATNSDGSLARVGLDFGAALPAGGYVAVGDKLHEDDFTLREGAVWHSTDGSDWTALAQLDGTVSELTAASMGGPGMVVFGVEQPEDEQGNITSIIRGWFAPLSELGG